MDVEVPSSIADSRRRALPGTYVYVCGCNGTYLQVPVGYGHRPGALDAAAQAGVGAGNGGEARGGGLQARGEALGVGAARRQRPVGPLRVPQSRDPAAAARRIAVVLRGGARNVPEGVRCSV